MEPILFQLAQSFRCRHDMGSRGELPKNVRKGEQFIPVCKSFVVDADVDADDRAKAGCADRPAPNLEQPPLL
jgi:hypothetical protein